MTNNTSNCSREQMLSKINEASFAVNDILLFLDTHPNCKEAINYYQEMMLLRKKYLEEYSSLYGPLTVDTAYLSDDDCWKWALQPFPWEMEGGRK